MTDIHADDYALSVNTSLDILQLIDRNLINSVSVLPNMLCFEQCANMWQEHQVENAKVSIHINLVEGHCLAPTEHVSLLTDSKGYLNSSWKRLLYYNYSFSQKRNQFKEQLKEEISYQIERVRVAYQLYGKLRIDAHQHTQMIPVVLEAVCEVIQEKQYDVEYIRDSHDLMLPYLKHIRLIPSYRPINMIKVLLLNHYSKLDKRKHNLFLNKGMFISGVWLSGRMDYERVKKVYPSFHAICEKQKKDLEILFHPGTLLETECGEEFINPDAVNFYLSENRRTELDSVQRFKKVDTAEETDS